MHTWYFYWWNWTICSCLRAVRHCWSLNASYNRLYDIQLPWFFPLHTQLKVGNVGKRKYYGHAWGHWDSWWLQTVRNRELVSLFHLFWMIWFRPYTWHSYSGRSKACYYWYCFEAVKRCTLLVCLPFCLWIFGWEIDSCFNYKINNS